MLYREFTEKYLADEPQLKRIALKAMTCTTEPWGDNTDESWLLHGLDYVAKLMEADRPWYARRPPWTEPSHPGFAPGEWVFQLHHRGLEYKPWSNYLTAEGWPTGTTCWYMCIEMGCRYYICAERPVTALLRGIIVMRCLLKWREIAPKKRPHIEEYIKEFCKP